jgi:hypothetical protein
MDVAGVALLDEVRQVARMIHVRVTQDDGVNLLRVERKAAIALDGFLAVALKEAAFEQQPLAVDLEQIHRAGGGARRAEEVDLHGEKMLKEQPMSSSETGHVKRRA